MNSLSRNPELARSLVELGIDSISVMPDTLLEVLREVLNVEQQLGRPPQGAQDGT
ncbi:hypothetical protein [Variovorax sp. YR216]|uniref:hypothetical protein n=1 Tax=Variovorax sp. YR216 TaxID=1882828 RepID=UPI0015A2545F|nr:hypothetical protein [Variovorax sp. YR216]